MSIAKPVYPNNAPLTKNTKQLTIGFGRILIQAFFTQVSDFDKAVNLRFGGPVAQIWPKSHEIIRWPPGAPLTDAGAVYVSEMFKRMMLSPRAIEIP